MRTAVEIVVDGAARAERSAVMLGLSLLTLLTVVGSISRPLIPIDETRYFGVAWEMWLRDDFLVPFKNGQPYSHKPPLLMWLFQAGWAVFGVNEWWPRLVSPLAGAGSLFLTMDLGRRLWPERAGIAGPAMLILVSGLLWSVFSTAAMFDIVLAFFVLAGMLGTLQMADGNARQGLLLLGLALGLGVLAKGPVIWLHVLPAALLAPWWNPELLRAGWYGRLFTAFLIGSAIALAWAIPAGCAGGEVFRRAIFWGQTADRIVESFAHRRPFWWYLPLLPVMLFPWFVWPGLWRALGRFVGRNLDRGGRFCLAWMLPVLAAFSCISGKQMHYLIPVFPAFSLLAARALADEQVLKGIWLPALIALVMGGGLLAVGWSGWPGRPDATPGILPALLLVLVALTTFLVGRGLSRPVATLAVMGVAVTALGQLAIMPALAPAYDVRTLAKAIGEAQGQGRQVVHAGTYHDQYHFAGRLRQPLVEIESTESVKNWLAGHPDDYAVVYAKSPDEFQAFRPLASQRYRGLAVALLDAPSARQFLSGSEQP